MSRIAAPLGRGDHADAPRQQRQRALALRGEQTFRRELCGQFLELALQSPESRVFHVIDDELVLAARLIQADASAHQHLLPILGRKGTQHISLAEHAAAHLRGGILQRKIPMSGAGPGEIGDLPLEPEAAEAAFQQHPHLAVEARNAVDVALAAVSMGCMILRFTAQHAQGTMRRLLRRTCEREPYAYSRRGTHLR